MIGQEKEFRELRTMIDRQFELENALIREHEELKDTATRLRGLLKRLQWEGYGHGGWPTCPICKEERDYGHADDCELAKELENA